MFTLEPLEQKSTKCKVCGRKLTRPESVRLRVGPVCGGTSRKGNRREGNQMSIEFKRQRPELVICMDTGDQWIGFDAEGKEIVSGRSEVEFAANVLAMYTEPDKGLAEGFTEVVRGATMGVVRREKVEGFIKERRAKSNELA